MKNNLAYWALKELILHPCDGSMLFDRNATWDKINPVKNTDCTWGSYSLDAITQHLQQNFLGAQLFPD